MQYYCPTHQSGQRASSWAQHVADLYLLHTALHCHKLPDLCDPATLLHAAVLPRLPDTREAARCGTSPIRPWYKVSTTRGLASRPGLTYRPGDALPFAPAAMRSHLACRPRLTPPRCQPPAGSRCPGYRMLHRLTYQQTDTPSPASLQVQGRPPRKAAARAAAQPRLQARAVGVPRQLVLVLLVQHDALKLGLEPLDGVFLGHLVLHAHARELLPPLGHAVARAVQHHVEVHACARARARAAASAARPGARAGRRKRRAARCSRAVGPPPPFRPPAERVRCRQATLNFW